LNNNYVCLACVLPSEFGAARIFAYGMAAKATLAQAKDH